VLNAIPPIVLDVGTAPKLVINVDNVCLYIHQLTSITAIDCESVFSVKAVDCNRVHVIYFHLIFQLASLFTILFAFASTSTSASFACLSFVTFQSHTSLAPSVIFAFSAFEFIVIVLSTFQLAIESTSPFV
jgi:hypothetical protein